MEKTLQDLEQVVAAAKKKTQNTSLDKFLLLWNYEEQIQQASPEVIQACQSKFVNLLVRDLILQDPAPPLRRVISEWVGRLCATTGAVSLALSYIKSLQAIIPQKHPLTAKIAAMECIGMIYTQLGSAVASSAHDAVALFIKQFKSNTAEKREVAAQSCCKILEGTGASGVFLHGPLLKNLKVLITDKEAPVRLGAANLLVAIGARCEVKHIDQLLQYAIKLCEDPSPHARSAAAMAIGNCLSLARESTVQSGRKGKDAAPPPSSGQPQKEWTVSAALDFLNSIFLRTPNSNAKRELRAGITLATVSYLQQLPGHVIRAEMNAIIERILSLLLNAAMKSYGTLNELLQAHLCTGHMLNNGMRDRLGEEGQRKMAESLIDVLNKDGFNEYILILALRQLSYLFLDLGQGAAPLWEKVELPLSKLLSHQSYSVRGVCAITARSLATALPDYHSKLLRAYINVTSMEFAQLASCKQEEIKLHLGPLQGNAYAVAGLISIIPHSVLGVPNAITKYCLKTARTLVKIDASCKYAAMMVARTEAGWSMISALMKLGPVFVERKLSDLLDMWDHCFQGLANPKVQPGTEKEVVIFSRLKSCALEALCNFIHYNQALLGEDIVERAVMWLKNILAVITKLPKLTNCQGSTTDNINILKANLVRAYTFLPVSAYAVSYVPLMTWLIHEVPRNATTSLFRSLLQEDDSILGPWLSGQELRDAKLIQSPAVVVHDHSVVWSSDPEKELTNPIPTSKRLVDEILDLFPQLYMVQTPEHQKTILTHLMRCVRESPPELKGSLQTNIFCLLLKTLRTLNEKKTPFPKGKFLKPLLLFIESFLSSTEVGLRRAAAECIGLMALLQGDRFTDHIINSIMQTLTVSKDSLTRAGCGFSLACIIRQLGAMRSAYHLPATVSILHVLAKDSEPLVHVWALHSLWITIETTSLSFAPFANPTLSLGQSLLLSPHCTTSATYQSIGQVVNACVSCLGPELQPGSTVFNTCRAIISELQANPNPLIQLEGIHFQQMSALFAPQTIKQGECMPFLRDHLQSRFPSLRRASVICLRQLVQIDAASVEREGGQDLEEQLLRMLDRERDADLRNDLQLLIHSLIDYLGPSRIEQYLDLFKMVISSSTSRRGASAPGKGAEQAAVEQEEEDEEEGENIDASGQLTQVSEMEEDDSVFVPRWRTRVFCMECIGKLINVTAQDAEKTEHFDMNRAIARLNANRPSSEDPLEEGHLPGSEKYLVFHLQDLVTVAFNSSTSSINALRPVGVKVLQDIVERFADAEDPQYEGHKLLELYSAQVAAALRPAFHRDRSPLLTAAATDVVVSFVKNTITAEVSALQKVSRLLTSFVEDVESLEYPSYSERASTMVQLKVLGAIAQLYVVTLSAGGKGEDGELLKEIIEPFLPKLCRLWMLVLRDWAILSSQPSSVQRSYKGAFYTFSSIAFVMDYYRDVRTNILLAQASLLGSEHWRDSDYDKHQANTPQCTVEDFSLLVGLCLHCLVEANDSDVRLATTLQAFTFLFTSSYLTPQWFPITQVCESLDLLQMQMQVGSAQVKCAVVYALSRIITHLATEYLGEKLVQGESDENEQAVLHTLVEIVVVPVQEVQVAMEKRAAAGSSKIPAYQLDNTQREALTHAFECMRALATVLHNQPMMELYGPALCSLLQRVAPLLTDSMLSSCLSTMAQFAKLSGQVLTSSICSILSQQQRLEAGQAASADVDKPVRTMNHAIALLSLLAITGQQPIPQSLHEQVLQRILAWLNSSQTDVKLKIFQILLVWFQSLKGGDSASPARWYLQKLTVWAITDLSQRSKSSISPADEPVVLESVKLLVVAHSNATESKSVMLAIVIPTLVSLLKDSVGKAVSDLCLKVVQTLGATDPTTFKEVADSLPSTLRSQLQNAANTQQQATSKVQTTRTRRARPAKALTLDFSQYE